MFSSEASTIGDEELLEGGFFVTTPPFRRVRSARAIKGTELSS